MRILKLEAIIILLLSPLFIYGQAPSPPTMQTAAYIPSFPPNPESANLGRYGNTPVSLQSGSPQITIPIATLSCGKLSTSVSLGYSSRGIKPSETASRVGLGWNLIAGGLISRTINGSNGIEGIVPLGMNTEANANDREVIESIVNGSFGVYDYEPDHYNYNVGAYSGSAFLSTLGDVTPIKGNESIKFTGVTYAQDFSGNKYYFDLEETTVGGYSISGDVMTARKPVTGWTSRYLTKMISFDDKDTIYFDYESYTTQQYSKQGGVTFTRSINDLFNEAQLCGGVSTSYTVVEMAPNTLYRIKCIRSRSFNCYFTYGAARLDSPGDNILSKIEIKNSFNACIEKVELNYTYAYSTNCVNGDYYFNFLHRRYWLMLDNLKLGCSSATTENQVYRFEYDPALLPCRDQQHGLDVFGYSNGADNVLFPNHGDDIFSSNHNLLGPDARKFMYGGVHPPQCPPQVDPLTNFQNLNANYAVINYDNLWPESCIFPPPILRAPNLIGTRAQTLTKIFYPTGGYTMYDYELNTESVLSNGSFINRYSGGLRIKKITDYDPMTSLVAQTKEYVYNLPDGRSSGYSHAKPVFSNYSFTSQISSEASALPGCTANCSFFSISTNPVNSGSIAFADPFTTYYTYVSEFKYSDPLNADTLLTVYEYFPIVLVDSPQTSSSGNSHPMNDELSIRYINPNTVDKIKSESKYFKQRNGIYKPVFTSDFDYQTSPSIQIKSSVLGIRAHKVFSHNCLDATKGCNRDNYYGPNLNGTGGFAGSCYDIQYIQISSSNRFLSSYSSSWLDVYSVNSISRQSSFSYLLNSINYLFKQYDSVSPSDVSRTKVLYTCDFNTSVFNSLKSKQILDRPVEIIQLRMINGSWYVIAASLANYNVKGFPTALYRLKVNEPILESAFSLSNSSPTTFVIDALYDKILDNLVYSSSGLLEQATDQAGRFISYKWDEVNSTLIGSFDNAQQTQTSLINFESGSTMDINQWSASSAISSSLTSEAFSGERALNPPGLFSLSRTVPAGKWILSVACKGSGDFIVQLGGAEIYRKTITDSWTPIEISFASTGQLLNITKTNHNQKWDDIVLHPAGSLYKSVTNNPLVGVTSVQSSNKATTRFKQDASNRLTSSFDSFGHAIFQVLYKYLTY